MADKIKQTIPVTDDLSVILYECADPRDGSYISIKHNTPKKGMEGESMLAPADAPALIHALSIAAIELTSAGFYHAGFHDGSAEQ